jgi:ABC-type amino acid transport substrate-binding protein
LKRLLTLLLLISFIFPALNVQASPIKVGVVNEAPFAFHKNGQYHGLSYALWDEIANRIGVKYTLVNASSDIRIAEKALANHEYDVLIGPVRVITSNISSLTFSRPYFLDHISLATREIKTSFWNILFSLVEKHGAGVISFFFALLLVFSFLIWLTETRHDTAPHKCNQFGKWLLGFWFAFVALFSLSFTSQPRTRLGRLVTGFWLIISLGFIALFSALVTSSLTVSHLSSNTFFSDAKMLNHKKIAAVDGSAANFTASYFGANLVNVNSIDAGLNLVEQRQATGFLGSAVAIKNALLKKQFPSLTLHPAAYHVSEIAFGFPVSNAALKDKVNRVLVNLQDTHKVLPLCRQYLNQKDSLACLI